MAASGSTPIALYYSPTASAVPVNTNLVNGELALNTTDEKLYFKNAAGMVKLLASNAASTPVTTFSGGTTGLTPASATSGAVTLAGTLAVANGGTGVTSSTGSGSNVLSVSPTLTTPLLGTPTSGVATNLTGLPLTTGVTGILPVANGGTNTATPALVAGTNVTITGTWPNQTVNSTGGIANFTSGVNTSAPNATIPYVSLTATNAATNVDVAIVPKGTGGFSLAVADNTTTGGNKRGSNAVDLQINRSSNTQISSGANSFSAGGYNTASGTQSVAIGGVNIASAQAAVAMGYSNTASGLYATALGYSNSAVGDYSFSVGSGNTTNNSYAIALGQTNTTSAANAIALGYAHSITATYGTALGGSNHGVSGSYSTIIGGQQGRSRSIIGLTSFPSAAPSSSIIVGTQFSLFQIVGNTSSTTPVILTSDAGTATAFNQLRFGINISCYFKGSVMAGITGGGNTKAWVIEGLVKCGASSATLAFVGTPTVTSPFADTGASTWTIAVTLDTTLGCLVVTATGQSATAIRWVSNIQATEQG